MKRLHLFGVMISVLMGLASNAGATPLVGTYRGTCNTSPGQQRGATAQVVNEYANYYRIMLQAPAPSETQEPVFLELYGVAEGPEVFISGHSGGQRWEGRVAGDHLSLTGAYGFDFSLDRYETLSPTLGEQPPQGAVVLTPYKEGAEPDLAAWVENDVRLKPMPEGGMQIIPGQQGAISNQHFGSVKLHVEFNLPLVAMEGQNRANSGVFFNGIYEIQVLDSFGRIENSGDCGSIYSICRPRLNASQPAGVWQTYDITFHAPKLDEQGNVVQQARMTVLHNGVLIHDDVQLPRSTLNAETVQVERGPIILQDHGWPVLYRNVWAVELNND